ncbi:PIN domain-containing protein [Oscillochloris sp. ZM17-4]|uniref:PIN domain-containing protein n=1 Tax=Oscillochloris sp. ZM17-4 TaxID=2866714 RepID=UPI001C739744|nr:PIN domain-containing protein [Oscillochloris sp. ZM17-4]MBX0328285.1 PIN domain-containing protein [Oscillochloris sp. ZM17-4]
MTETTPASAAFLDTNIWLYAFISGQDALKAQKAKALIAATQPLFLSIQVVNEVCTNLIRKGHTPETDIRDVIDDFYALYQVIDLDHQQLLTASDLRNRYPLSFWDSLIIASALQSGVPTLYSEDMQHGFVVDQKLRIVNPFLL